MPISDVVFLVIVAAAVGWVVVLAIRSNRSGIMTGRDAYRMKALLDALQTSRARTPIEEA